MIHIGTGEATELLEALGVIPTSDRIDAVLAWEHKQSAKIRRYADQMTWLVEQHQNLLDMLMAKMALPKLGTEPSR